MENGRLYFIKTGYSIFKKKYLSSCRISKSEKYIIIAHKGISVITFKQEVPIDNFELDIPIH